MLSYHSKPSSKEAVIQAALQHEQTDTFVKGTHWEREEKKGCNIGYWTKDENGNHASVSAELGLPVELLHLSDGMFEALPDPYYKTWSRRFAQAIPVGVDFSAAWAKYLHWVICDQQWGLTVLAESAEIRATLRLLADYFAAVKGSHAPDPSDELTLAIAYLKRDLATWASWDEQGIRDMRAGREVIEIWNARFNEPKSLARAAWAARAAWTAWEAYTLAQAEALIEQLTASNPALIKR